MDGGTNQHQLHSVQQTIVFSLFPDQVSGRIVSALMGRKLRK